MKDINKTDDNTLIDVNKAMREYARYNLEMRFDEIHFNDLRKLNPEQYACLGNAFVEEGLTIVDFGVTRLGSIGNR